MLRVVAPGGREILVPAFWPGEGAWRARITAAAPGLHSFRTITTDRSNHKLHGIAGTLRVGPYSDSNPLLRHGPLRVSGDRRYLKHADGTPFFWMGDTWWMGLVKRFRWPEDFRALIADRTAKGFNVVQIVAGLYADMGAFDPRGENEAGFPWEKDYTRINPAYFDMAYLRMQHLADAGIVPRIVGAWGYHLPWPGMESMKLHWRYLVAALGSAARCLVPRRRRQHALVSVQPERRGPSGTVEWLDRDCAICPKH